SCQIGVLGTDLCIVIAVIYENPNKKPTAERFKIDLSALTSLNNDFIISGDHMIPDAELISEIGDEGVLKVLDSLYDVKKPELLVGKHLPREDAINMTEDRKSTRLNSSHVSISYAVFCLKNKKIKLHDKRERLHWHTS